MVTFSSSKQRKMTTKIQRSKDPKIQKGDNHHSRVRFSFHFHYLKTKNPDREKIDVKLKMARTSLVIKSVTSPNKKMPPADQRTIQLNIMRRRPSAINISDRLLIFSFPQHSDDTGYKKSGCCRRQRTKTRRRRRTRIRPRWRRRRRHKKAAGRPITTSSLHKKTLENSKPKPLHTKQI